MQNVVTNVPTDQAMPTSVDSVALVAQQIIKQEAHSNANKSFGSELSDKQPALSVTGLTKVFRSGFLRRAFTAIEDVSFTVRQGSVFALLGHNGAGKTTTINCILDLVHADRGEVRILGRDHGDQSARANLGFLPERPYFFEHLTGRELLEFYGQLLDIPKNLRRTRISEVLQRTGMTEAADRRLRKYSKGMLQRIGLAQTLIGDPDLLILDEPMSGLDPLGRRQVRDLLQELKSAGKTIILSSHIVPDVETLADSVGILKRGHMVLTRELATEQDGCSYQVSLRRPSFWANGAELPPWLINSDGWRVGVSGASAETLPVLTDDVCALRGLLDRCHREAVPVLSVDPRSSGLEDLFLQTTTGKGEQR